MVLQGIPTRVSDFCIRDCNSEVFGAVMGQIGHVDDALCVEAIVCLKASEFAADVGMG